MLKGVDGSKSTYISHIGGFFIFIGFAGISLILWGLLWHCWSKKSCCLKEYHNNINNRAFWWICLIFLCGIFACCVSGFITSINFRNNINSTKCAYERIYYDSKYGELKQTIKWEGLERITSSKLFEKFEDMLDNKKYNNEFVLGESWEKGDGIYLSNYINYTKNFKDELYKIIDKCSNAEGAIRNEIGDLLCDSTDMKNQNSYLIKYIDDINRITHYFYNEIIILENFLSTKDKKNYIESYEKEKTITINKLGNISQDLNNYETEFLSEVDFYVNGCKKWGYILITIFYSLLLIVALFSCFLLWAYSFFKQQKIIVILMHISWNFLKYFSFSFFIFGAAFGVSYKISRDLIGYNMFLFSNENLSNNVKTYLLPTGESKEFLRFCFNDEDSNYMKKIDLSMTNLIVNLDTNLKEIKHNFQINNQNNFEEFKKSFKCYTIANTKLAKLEEMDNNEGNSDIIIEDLSFFKAGTEFQNMINYMYNKFYQLQTKRFLQNNDNITKDIEELGIEVSSFDCGFLKNELQILYDTLYELSIESRISCAICCCIGFFGEISVLFYLLVMYHYNNEQFKDGDDNFRLRQRRKYDQESQDEFMNKNRPSHIRENNKRLDFEFNFN